MWRRFPKRPSSSTINQLEDIVEDEVVARRVAHQLEGLSVVHGTLFFVDLLTAIRSDIQLD